MSTVARIVFREYVDEAPTPRKFEGSDLAARKSKGGLYGCGTTPAAASETF